MVLVRVDMKGAGTQLDPLHSGFPHAITVAVDYAANTMIVNVPNRLIPPTLRNAGIIRTNIAPFGSVVTGIDLADHPKLLAFIDATYPEVAGLFQPDIK